MNNRLFTFTKFPLSVCTQDGPLSDNEELIEAYIEENPAGLISFLPYVDPSRIYLSQHNSSIGQTWKMHNLEFAKHLLSTGETSFVDIGGGSGNIYKSTYSINPDVSWKIIDLNPTLDNVDVETIQGLYDPSYIEEGDVVITSHFLEHQNDPQEFLTRLWERNPKYHIFSLPNFKSYARKNYSATIMFEHPNYLTEDYLEYLLHRTGWKILNKHYYADHSIFYTTTPGTPADTQKVFNCREEIDAFLQYMQNRAQQLVAAGKPFYVFGAHFTYYYLLNMGVSQELITAVVDNDPAKQGKRMYGTNTRVISPKELPVGADVFVEMGPYNEEISNNLSNVNII